MKNNSKKTLVIGLGTGRCGTNSLASLLNEQKSSIMMHEMKPLKWISDDKTLYENIYFLSVQLFRVCDLVGDVGFYYLPFVEKIIRYCEKGNDIFKRGIKVKFVCMKRDKIDTVRSYVRKVNEKNHWMCHDGKKWQKDDYWDSSYPKYKTRSREEAIGKYWDGYYQEAHDLERKYGNTFKIFEVNDLNSKMRQRDILKFVGISKGFRYNVGVIKNMSSKK